ncbi:uncharacterized protein LOC134658994 [Cydia amplana]|uniref:uncharacterized protein LOC134658994 n=1 Tax=Cydia amplana TaxID=1869771 RepID=UPI002FE66DBD
MEERIRRFDSVCVAAVHHIGRLQEQARNFLSQLLCEPGEFKHRFLQTSRQLDEFMYAVTDFNLAASTFETNSVNMDPYHPVPPKNPQHAREISSSHSNTPSHSNTQRLPTKDRKSYKREKGMNNTRQTYKKENCRESNGRDLNNTEGNETVVERNEVNNMKGNETVVERNEVNNTEGNETVVERNEDLPDTGCKPVGLPPQPKLDPLVPEATIVTVEGAQLWIVVDDTSFFKLMEDMLNYYQNREMVEDFIPKSVCAYYDESETRHILRALYITSEDGDPEVFLVDTGEFQPATHSRLFPLAPQFATTPPLAHLCYLADVEQTEDKTLEDRRTEFLQQYLGQRYKIKLVEDLNEDGSLQSLGVYVYLDDGTTVNERVQALDSNDPELNNNSKSSINNENIHSLTEINKINKTSQNDKIKPDENESIILDKSNENIDKDISSKENKMLDKVNTFNDEIYKDTNLEKDIIETDEINDKRVDGMDLRPDEDRVKELEAIENMNLDEMKYTEHENAVEAVTGYSNRDEMEICKHYKGGEGCFKGNRCKKRHVKIHPDGWTLDRVSVHVKCPSPPLPPPGTWLKLKVTHVDDTCQLYVHFEGPEEPMSLADVVDEMTLAAENSGPLKLVPAPGELVSAPYEGSHYRARVISAHDSVEVFYIDYGNTATVSISDLRPLEPRWLTLPARAVPCRLAGVSVSDVSVSGVSVSGVSVSDVSVSGVSVSGVSVSVSGVDVSETLRGLTLDRTMQAQIMNPPALQSSVTSIIILLFFDSARGLDEVTLKLIDADGFDIGEQLAVFAGITLKPYDVEHDEQRCVLVPA